MTRPAPRGSGTRCEAGAPFERFGATQEDWLDWRWQQRHTVNTVEELARHLRLTADEREGLARTAAVFRLGTTPYYLSLADPDHPFCPVRMQIVPKRSEARVRKGELLDPLGEDRHRPVRSIVHRYPDRVLLLALDRCAVYCRHCTRRRITGGAEPEIDRPALAEALDYVAAHAEVRDVLISGGDPFLLGTHRLESILDGLKHIPHVEMIRIGTRIPVCNPMRVTLELTSMLRRFHPLFVVTHFNHPKEVTPESRLACESLVDAGIPVENQAVLMRRLNSSARTIKDLCHRMLRMRVRPYYLHQMDVAEGLSDLRTPLAKGIEIIEAMRGHTTGLAVPHLAVDLPGGGGKVTLQPQYLVSLGEQEAIFRNHRGETYVYPEPEERDCTCPYDERFYP
jgi:lysine 2,3-aminomutase